jgi:hypothetical protein
LALAQAVGLELAAEQAQVVVEAEELELVLGESLELEQE